MDYGCFEQIPKLLVKFSHRDDCSRALLGGSNPPLRVTCKAEEGATGAPAPGVSHSEAVPQKMEGEQFEENIYRISKGLTWNIQDHLT